MTSSTPSLATAVAELRDATRALDAVLAQWWKHTEEEAGEVSKRWWLARKQFSLAMTGTPQEAAS